MACEAMLVAKRLAVINPWLCFCARVVVCAREVEFRAPALVACVFSVVQDSLHPVGHSELREDPVNVRLDGRDGQEEL